MPIVSPYPWRQDYFKDIDCPNNVIVPTTDSQAYPSNPDYNFVYNKLFIASSQGLKCAPHGIIPSFYPVFSKPIYNLRGNGVESRILHAKEDYESNIDSGHMWCELLSGDHISTDVAVVNGKMVWALQTIAITGNEGTFEYFHIVPSSKGDPKVNEHLSQWIEKHMSGYTGMMNFEMIGNYIIEGHLRFSDMWADLYGKDWLKAVVNLYTNKQWNFEDNIEESYAVMLYVEHGSQYVKPPVSLMNEWISQENILSIQFPFHEDKVLGYDAMPPGGFRYAQVNSNTLEAGLKCRSLIEDFYNLSNNDSIQKISA